jgi:hypothetical protein
VKFPPSDALIEALSSLHNGLWNLYTIRCELKNLEDQLFRSLWKVENEIGRGRGGDGQTTRVVGEAGVATERNSR